MCLRICMSPPCTLSQSCLSDLIKPACAHVHAHTHTHTLRICLRICMSPPAHFPSPVSQPSSNLRAHTHTHTHTHTPYNYTLFPTTVSSVPQPCCPHTPAPQVSGPSHALCFSAHASKFYSLPFLCLPGGFYLFLLTSA